MAKRAQRRSVLLAALLVLALAPVAHAATLDTPALLDLTSSGNFICNFTNLDTTQAAAPHGRRTAAPVPVADRPCAGR